MSEGTMNNPALYKAMNKPFKTEEEHGEAIRMFFRAVEDYRRLYKLPDVVVIVRSSHKPKGKDEQHSISTLCLGDSAAVVWLICETLNRFAVRAEEAGITITPHMIAAAPDLLRELQLIAEQIEHTMPRYEPGITEEQYERIKAALTKARGEQEQ